VRLRDGLYRVTTATLCAGFVIEAGRLAACAPILRRRIALWMRRAEWIAP
jgi:hypothetical protein